MDIDCYVSGIFATILRWARYCGVAPLQFNRDGTRWRVRLSKRVLCNYIVIIVCVCTPLSLSLLYNQLSKPESMAKNYQMARTLDCASYLFILIVLACVSVATAPQRWERLIHVFRKLEQINSNLGYKPSKDSKTKIAIVIVSLVFLFVVSLADVLNMNSTIVPNISGKMMPENLPYVTLQRITYFSYFPFLWTIQMNILVFVLVVMEVHASFLAINANLEKLWQELTTNRHQFDHYKIIRKVSRAYEDVNKAVKEVNSCFGLHLFLYLGFLFIEMNGAHYYLILSLMNDVSLGEHPDITVIFNRLINISWCVFLFLNLVLIVSPSHSTHVEIRAIREHVSKLFLRTRSVHDPLAVELEVLYKILLLERATYTPMNFCTLSRGLILTFCGNIATYLTILIDIS